MAATLASTPQSIMVALAAAIRRALPRSLAIAAATLLMSIVSLPSSAADTPAAKRSWIVQELKGAAFTRPRAGDDGQWRSLQAGARIEPGNVVRTDDSGRIELTNGIDQIRLSPSSEIELPMQRDGDPVTRVIHWVGTAFFHVGKRPGPQFEVDTPYIVAIVKGTKFTTTVSDAGAAVKVSEGVVGVSATAGGNSIDVTAGGSASVSAAHSDTVTPGGPSGDAAPAGNRGKGSTLVDTSAPSTGGAVGSAGADDDSVGGSPIGRGGRGGEGNGHGRDDQESEGDDLVIGNGDGQGGVDGGGDGDHGGGCHGHRGHHGRGHHYGNQQDDHGHGGHRH
jgi:hypothetical protein